MAEPLDAPAAGIAIIGTDPEGEDNSSSTTSTGVVSHVCKLNVSDGSGGARRTFCR